MGEMGATAAENVVAKGEFLSAVVSAGIIRIWETRKECASYLKITGEEQEKIEGEMYARDLKDAGEETATARATQRLYERRMGQLFFSNNIPLWRVLGGMTLNEEKSALHPNERAGRFAAVIRAIEKVVRYEWRAFIKQKAEGAGQNTEKRELRVRWWDPMRVVCQSFGIAHSMLSKMSRELTGLSAPDLTDRVKAETLRSSMRLEVKAWVLELYKECEFEEKATAAEIADGLWSGVAQKRGRGRWSRASWAARFGYSSYVKFSRACLAEHGVTPVELEREILEEIVGSLESEETQEPGAVLERGSDGPDEGSREDAKAQRTAEDDDIGDDSGF